VSRSWENDSSAVNKNSGRCPTAIKLTEPIDTWAEPVLFALRGPATLYKLTKAPKVISIVAHSNHVGDIWQRTHLSGFHNLIVRKSPCRIGWIPLAWARFAPAAFLL